MGVKRAGTVCAAAWVLAVSLMGGSGAHGQVMDDGWDFPSPFEGLAVQGNGGLVAVLRERGAEVRALGRVGDLEGWLVVPEGQAPYTLYTDGTGHAVMGLLFSPEGKALSAGQVRAVQATVGRRSGPEPVVRTRVRSKDEGRLSRGEARRSPVVQRDLFPGAAGAEADPDAAACAAGKAGAPLARKWAADTRTPERSLRGIFEAALAVEGFDLGESGPEVAIFADPTCVPSRAAVAELARRALEGWDQAAGRTRRRPRRGGRGAGRAGAGLGEPCSDLVHAGPGWRAAGAGRRGGGGRCVEPASVRPDGIGVRAVCAVAGDQRQGLVGGRSGFPAMVRRRSGAMKGGIAAAAALVALCFVVASPGSAGRYGGMTQDLLYRVRPLGEPLYWLLNVLLVFLLGLLFVFLVRAWRRPGKEGLVVFGSMFAVVAGFWWFGPGYLEARMFEARMLPGADGWQR